MSKSDAEMEDAEKLPRESGDNAQEPESKSLASHVESKGGAFPCEGTQENANKTENGGEDLNKCAVTAQCKATVNSEVEGELHPNRETVEPMDAEHFQTQVMPGLGPVGELVKDKCETVDLIHTKTMGEEQAGAGNAVEKHTDTTDENVKQNTGDGGLKEVQSADNGLDSENHVKNVEEKPDADIVVKMPKESNGLDRDSVEHVPQEENTAGTRDAGKFPADASDNKAVQSQSALLDEIPRGDDKEMENAANSNEDETVTEELKEQRNESSIASPVTGSKENTVETSAKYGSDDSSHPNQHEPATPNSHVRYSPAKDGDHSGQAVKTVFTQATLPLMAEGDDGTTEEQAAFMKELDSFYRQRAMDFKPPKFYGQPLNCLKLWRSVIRLGGYDRVTGSKLWRQVGESFHPPKTCTTVSWTFRIFYEKSLLEFERYKIQCGELQLPLATLPEAFGVEHEGNGQGTVSISGRARRDAAARAMQGWHVQRIFDNGEVGEPVIKDKNPNNTAKREKNLKSIGSIKQKRPTEVESSVKVARTETYKQLVTSVVDVGPPADWVKINIRQTKDCFEVYALVPGLLREEVRVQSDPAGRLVITGQPEQVDNPWGITPFKKVVSLPARIDPLQTSAVVSLHGRLFVRVPFEQPNI